MGLAEVQAAQAHLYTRADLRARFFADPAGVGRELGLTPEESARLAEMPGPQVDSFARALVAKRRGEVAKLLPGTAAVLGQRFGLQFRRFAEVFVPRGLKKHRADALLFAAFLDAALGRDPDAPPWARDLARSEAALLQVSDPSCRVLVRRFDYAVADLADALRAGPPPPDVALRPTLILWLRPRGGGPPRQIEPFPRRRARRTDAPPL